MIKNPLCNEGDVGLIPGQGTEIPHGMEQLNLCATCGEFMRHSERSQVPQLRPVTAR